MRLRERVPELEQAIMTRIRASAPIDEHAEPEYLHGIRSAIRAAIDYSLLNVEHVEREPLPIPLVLLTQARLAARHGVPIGTVLRRYTLGYNQLSDLVVEEAERDRRLTAKDLRQVLRQLAVILELTLEELEGEYAREPQQLCASSDGRLAERVRRGLAGELVDLSDLNYNLEGCHIGAVAEGDSAPAAFTALAKAVDGRLLLVRPRTPLTWAWIGSHERIAPIEFNSRLRSTWPSNVPLALGEPGSGRSGWVLTHEQAKTAFPFAIREGAPSIRFSEVALKVAIERDALAASSLRQLSTVLLGSGGEGAKLINTLRAYLKAGRNGASAAAELGLTRQTVSNHVRKIEQRLGRSLGGSTADLEIALWLSEEDSRHPTSDPHQP